MKGKDNNYINRSKPDGCLPEDQPADTKNQTSDVKKRQAPSGLLAPRERVMENLQIPLGAPQDYLRHNPLDLQLSVPSAAQATSSRSNESIPLLRTEHTKVEENGTVKTKEGK